MVRRRGRKFHQGFFRPRNPSKYVGRVDQIVFRSGWELKAMKYFDLSPHILQWSSEETVIPYVSPVDGRVHRYFVDFWVRALTSSGEVREHLVEVKPKTQTKKPRRPSSRLLREGGRKAARAVARYEKAVETYAVNLAKWKAAEEYCRARGWKFIIADEDALKISGKKK